MPIVLFCSNAVARHGVFHAQMLSPIGRNAIHCCLRYRVRLDKLASINKSFVVACVNSQYSDDTVNTALMLLELLLVRFNYYSLPSWTQTELKHFIELLSTL